MKSKNVIWIAMMFVSSLAHGAAEDTLRWEYRADANFYLIPNDFFVLPVFAADKNKLHLEVRYNYEDMKTFSAWMGYNIKGGNKLEYTITPMIGGVTGQTNGVAPGLELTLARGRFELYMETEFLFDLDLNENNFFYNWTDITYSATDWLWFGVSGQRTRLYQTDLDLQRGILLGAGKKNWELTTYLYNPGLNEPFGLITFSVNF